MPIVGCCSWCIWYVRYSGSSDYDSSGPHTSGCTCGISVGKCPVYCVVGFLFWLLFWLGEPVYYSTWRLFLSWFFWAGWWLFWFVGMRRWMWPIFHSLWVVAAYRFLINRMHNLPLNKNHREHEWQTILQIAKTNRFPIALIHNLKHRMTQERKQPPLPFPHSTHTTHEERKMGYIHLLIPTNQKSHQPTQKKPE